MPVTAVLGYAAAALIGGLSTYIFATAIEARRASFQRHLEAQESSVLDLRRWREAFARDWFSRQLGRGGRFPKAPGDDLKGLASTIIQATERMPRWKNTLVRKALVAFVGDTALLASWLGPLRDAYEERGEDSWFSAVLELGNHFDDDVASALSDRASRFTEYDGESWREIWDESIFLERALGAKWRHRLVLSVSLTDAETEALREFGFLPSWRRSWRRSRLMPTGTPTSTVKYAPRGSN